MFNFFEQRSQTDVGRNHVRCRVERAQSPLMRDRCYKRYKEIRYQLMSACTSTNVHVLVLEYIISSHDTGTGTVSGTK